MITCLRYSLSKVSSPESGPGVLPGGAAIAEPVPSRVISDVCRGTDELENDESQTRALDDWHVAHRWSGPEETDPTVCNTSREVAEKTTPNLSLEPVKAPFRSFARHRMAMQ
jgi:hypothetical protein